jgi:hypothetical protein
MEIAAIRPRLRAAFAALVAAAVGVSLFATAQTRADEPPTRNDHFTINTNLLRPSGYTADELNAFVRRQGHASSGLAHDGDAFVKAEKDTGVNAQYLLAHAIHESGWGTSSIYREKHNLFGISAFDRSPGESATTFKDDADCIDYMAHFVKRDYLSPDGKYFNGATLKGMNEKYATDKGWAEKIANIADDMYSPKAEPPPAPAPTDKPESPGPGLLPGLLSPPTPAPQAPPPPAAKPAAPAPTAAPPAPAPRTTSPAPKPKDPSSAGWPNTGLGGAA